MFEFYIKVWFDEEYSEKETCSVYLSLKDLSNDNCAFQLFDEHVNKFLKLFNIQKVKIDIMEHVVFKVQVNNFFLWEGTLQQVFVEKKPEKTKKHKRHNGF